MKRTEEIEIDTFSTVSKIAPFDRYSISGEDLTSFMIRRFEKVNYPIDACISHPLLPNTPPYKIYNSNGYVRFIYWSQNKKLQVFKKFIPMANIENPLELEFEYLFPKNCSNIIYFPRDNFYYTVCRTTSAGTQPMFLYRVDTNGIGYSNIFIGTILGSAHITATKLIKLPTGNSDHISMIIYKLDEKPFWLIVMDSRSNLIFSKEYIHEKEIKSIIYIANSVLIFKSQESGEEVNRIARFIPGDYPSEFSSILMGAGKIMDSQFIPHLNRLAIRGLIIKPKKNYEGEFGTKSEQDEVYFVVYYYDPESHNVYIQKMDQFLPLYKLAGIGHWSDSVWRIDMKSVQMLKLSNVLRLIRFRINRSKYQGNNVTEEVYFYSRIINIETYEYLKSQTYLEMNWDGLYQLEGGHGIWAFNRTHPTIYNRRNFYKCSLYWFEIEDPSITKIISPTFVTNQKTADCSIKLKKDELEMNSAEILKTINIKIVSKEEEKLYENTLYYPEGGLQNKTIKYMKEHQRIHIDRLVSGGFVRELPLPSYLDDIPGGYRSENIYLGKIMKVIDQVYEIVISEGQSFVSLMNNKNKEVNQALERFSLVNYTIYNVLNNNSNYRSVKSGVCFNSYPRGTEDLYCIFEIQGENEQQLFKKQNEYLEPIGSTDIGKIQRIIHLGTKRTLLHTQSGDIYLASMSENLTLINIPNPGKKCEEISLGALDNSASILYCLSSDDQFTIMNLNELIKGLNSISILYQSAESLFNRTLNISNIEMFSPTGNGLNGYLLIFTKGTNYLQVNTYIIFSQIDTHFDMRLEQSINLRPTPSQSDAAFGVVVDIEIMDNHLVQLIQGIDDEQFICVYKMKVDKSHGFQIWLKSCYMLPSYFRFDSHASLGFYHDLGSKDPDFKGYMTLEIEKEFGKGRNIALIDIESSSYSRIRTYILPTFSTDKITQIPIVGESREAPSLTTGLILSSEDLQDLTARTIFVMPRFGEVGIDIYKYSIKKKYHDTIIDSHISKTGLDREFINALFVNDIELNFLKSGIKQKIISLNLEQILPESTKIDANHSIETINEIEVDGSSAKTLEVGDEIYRVNRNSEMNVIFMQIKQDYNDFELDENIRIEEFNITFRTESRIRILQICRDMEVDNEVLDCFNPEHLIDNGKMLIPFNTPHLKTASVLQGLYYKIDCSRPFTMYTKIMQICSVEGDRYLEITDYNSLNNRNIMLPELTDGDSKDYRIDTFMLKLYSIFSVRIYINGMVESVAIYSLNNTEKSDNEQITISFIDKDKLKSDKLFWTLYHEENHNLSVDDLSFCRVDKGLLSYEVMQMVGDMRFLYNNRLYEINTKYSTPSYEYSYSLEKEFEAFVTVGTKMINFKKEINSNFKDANPILNFIPLADSFLMYWSMADNLIYGFRNGRRLRFSNPFIGLQTISNPDPICREWLCIFCHVFPTNSYLSLYFLDSGKIDKLDLNFPYRNNKSEGGASPHYDIRASLETNVQILDALRENYTIYTFKVINETGIEFEQLFWDPKKSRNSSELSFYAVSSGNITKKYTISSTSSIKLRNPFIDLNGREINLFMRGTMGKNISKRLKLTKFNKNESISNNVFGIVALICSVALLVFVLGIFITLEDRSELHTDN